VHSKAGLSVAARFDREVRREFVSAAFRFLQATVAANSGWLVDSDFSQRIPDAEGVLSRHWSAGEGIAGRDGETAACLACASTVHYRRPVTALKGVMGLLKDLQDEDGPLNGGQALEMPGVEPRKRVVETKSGRCLVGPGKSA
jgi:hypothetical protein